QTVSGCAQGAAGTVAASMVKGERVSSSFNLFSSVIACLENLLETRSPFTIEAATVPAAP
ncbi:hypothetical protein, partial [Escherichia coli]|uniref:hypothetical protein n=1 Tax=Escherichia coli TaxID=562 RepID=UPI001BC89C8B